MSPRRTQNRGVCDGNFGHLIFFVRACQKLFRPPQVTPVLHRPPWRSISMCKTDGGAPLDVAALKKPILHVETIKFPSSEQELQLFVMKHRRETARRAAIFCSQVLERAASTTDLGEAPSFASRLARRGLPKVDSVNHPAIVDPARLGDLLRAIDAYTGQSEVIRDSLKFLAFMFPRPGKLRNALGGC